MFNWFKKKTEPKSEPVPEQQPQNENVLVVLLSDLLANQIDSNRIEPLKDVPIDFSDGTVFIRQYNLEIMCNVLDLQDHGHVLVYRLGFIVKINGEGIFYEEMAAIGSSPFAALLDGAASYHNGFLQGFFLSYFGYYEPAYEINDIQGSKLHLICSQLQVQGEFKDDESLDETGFLKIMFPLLKEMFIKLAKSEDYKINDYYWVKIYLSRNNGNFIGECRLNNKEWNSGLNLLLEEDYNNWKVTDNFLAKKQFIFIKRCPQ